MDMFGETDAGCGPDAPVDQPAGHDCEPAPPAEDAAPGRETCEGAVDHVLRDCLVAGGGDEHAARRLADYVAEAPVRRAARLADGGVTMQMLDEACEAIGRLGLPREEVERRWPSLAVVILSVDRGRIQQMRPEDPPPLDEARLARERARLGLRADFDRLRATIAAARPDVVAVDGARVVAADLKTASRARDELGRALAHELAPEPRLRRFPWEILVLAAIAAATLGLALGCG